MNPSQALKSIGLPPARYHLVGVMGGKGTGKTHLAKMIYSQLMTRFGHQKVKLRKFAHPIYQILELFFEMDYQWLTANKDRELVDGKTVRQMLQWLGTDVFRNQLDQDFWLNRLLEKYVMGQIWIIDDVRFPNEAVAIKNLGGKLVKIVPQDGTAVYDNHPSERELDSFVAYDYEVMNDLQVDLSGMASCIVSQLDNFWFGSPLEWQGAEEV